MPLQEYTPWRRWGKAFMTAAVMNALAAVQALLMLRADAAAVHVDDASGSFQLEGE